MNKKFVSMAVTTVCALSLSVSAFGAVKKDYNIKYLSPAFCSNVLSGEEFTNRLNACLEKLKEQGFDCNINIFPENNLKPLPEHNKPSIETDKEEEKPETEKPETEKPEANEKPSASSNQTAKEAAFAAEVIDLVNKERAAYGLSPLSQDLSVQAAAQVRSVEQTELFSHTRPNGNSCFTVLGEKGISYKGAGENIAYGQKTPAEVVKAWMNSEGHRANILSRNFTDIGVGCYISPSGTIYWTQLFIY